MKKWKIKYQKGNDICVVTYEERIIMDAICKFYLDNPECDILSIEEVSY